jgi:hypothetical protein
MFQESQFLWLTSKYIIFHGLIVFLVGVLAGVPFWLTIIGNKGNEVIRAWRVAHSFLSIFGMLMLIVGLLSVHLIIGAPIASVLLWSFVAAGYSFVIAFIVGAWKGYRALTPWPYGLNTFLFVCHVIGISSSLISIDIIIYGSLKTIL